VKFIALDPGKQLVYGAQFRNNICVSLHEYPREVAAHARSTFPLAVVEKPNILNVPNTSDMAEVLWSGAVVASALSEHVSTLEPSVWKGILKKPIHHGRVWEWMTPAERDLFPPDAAERIQKARSYYAAEGRVIAYSPKWHNHLDALALGMFYLGRILRGGVKGPTNV